jgi:lysophospholipase L1-like esterase
MITTAAAFAIDCRRSYFHDRRVTGRAESRECYDLIVSTSFGGRVYRRFSALSLLLWCCVCAAQTQVGGEDRHWVATWGTAQQLAAATLPVWVVPPPREPDEPPPQPLLPPYPTSFRDETVRMIVRTSVGGEGLRLTLSNALGVDEVHIGAVRVALRERGSAIVQATDRAVTFSGKSSFSVQPGALVVSDPVALTVPALAELSVSLYLPNETDSVTTHEFALNTSYVAAGNAAGAAALPNAATNLTYFWLTGVEVRAPAAAGAIVALGDSITDGVSTTPDAHRAWPALLAARLQSSRATSHWAVINAGISGNRVRRDVIGTSALGRFDRDVLARAGVRWVVLFEGINDVTFSALPGIPESQRATADRLIESLGQLVDRAHARGVKVMGGTLMPMSGLWLYNAETEAMRQTVNDWIRTSGKFDAVADFDAATRDPDQPTRLLPAFDSGDHIHPNDAGNAAMADAIDTAVFAR